MRRLTDFAWFMLANMALIAVFLAVGFVTAMALEGLLWLVLLVV